MLSLSLCQYWNCLIIVALNKVLKLHSINLVTLGFFFKAVCVGPLHVYVNLRMSLAVLQKKCAGVLIGIALNLQANLEITDFLTIVFKP